VNILEKETMESGFWDDPQKAQEIISRLNYLKGKIKSYGDLKDQLDELNLLVEMAEEEDQDWIQTDLTKGIKELTSRIEKLKLDTLLYGKYDKNNGILTLHAGAGGTEAQDWVEMLFRMYTRWSEDKGYKVEILDLLQGDEAGIKSVTFQVNGINAYGYLKAEKGVHRLVRISPFDASGRRHTSFASLDVMPEVNEDIEIDIKSEDLKIDTYRAGGAGGQHVNKTDSAVRITHMPTGIVVQCQNERSQHSNKERAMKLLKAKLIELMEREQKEKLDQLRGVNKEIAWGSQIRSYVFHPYSLVKDHRTQTENGNVQKVMDGDIDAFINSYLKQQATEKRIN
jgi:peptide chain release factor 2